MNAAFAGPPVVRSRPARAGALQNLDALRDTLLALFAAWPQAGSRRRSVLQKQLLLELELRWNIEEQALLPALQEAEQAAAGPIALASRELELLRDLAVLLGQTVAANRQIVLAVLEGLARLHFTRIDALTQSPGAAAVDWPALDEEVAALAGHWLTERDEPGALEDEDQDPVGLPPR